MICTPKFNHFTTLIINNDDKFNLIKKDVNYYYDENSSFHDIRKVDELIAFLLSELPYLVLYCKNN